MKKIIIYSTIFCAALVACSEKKEANTNLAKYEKNLVIAKQFYEAFTSKDSVKEETLLADDLKWNGPAIGQDSLSKDQLMTGDKEFMRTFTDAKLVNADYYPGLDSAHNIDGGVRVYGTMTSKFVSSGKTSKVKYYAVLKINDAGKITLIEEYYNTSDLMKEL